MKHHILRKHTKPFTDGAIVKAVVETLLQNSENKWKALHSLMQTVSRSNGILGDNVFLLPKGDIDSS